MIKRVGVRTFLVHPMSLRYSQNNATHVAKMWALKCLGYHLIVGPKNALALELYLALLMLAKRLLKIGL
jgi:hypothetical protein